MLSDVARDYKNPHCAVARTAELIGDGWTLLVLREAFFGARRFSDFARRLAIAKNILSSRLATLVEGGIFEKVPVGKMGERFEYRLTPMGKDLATILTALRQWGDRWLFGEGNEPLLVLDRQTGEPIPPVRIRREDGSLIRGRDMMLVAGPGLGRSES